MSEAADGPERSTTEHQASPRLPWVNFGAFALAVAGVCLPWVTGAGGSSKGVDTQAGTIFAVALFITFVLTGPSIRRVDRETTWALALAWFSLLVIAVFEIVRLSGQAAQPGALVHIGSGLYLCTLAAAVGTAAATLAVAERWLAQCADPWMTTHTPWLPSVAAGTMLFVLCGFAFLGHNLVPTAPVSVSTSPAVAVHAKHGASAGGTAIAPTPAGSPTTSALEATSTTAASGDTGNTAPTGPGDFPASEMDQVWPGYTGVPGSSYVWPGYTPPGWPTNSGDTGASGATGSTGSTGNTGTPPSTTTSVIGTAINSASTPPGVSAGGGNGVSEASD